MYDWSSAGSAPRASSARHRGGRRGRMPGRQPGGPIRSANPISASKRNEPLQRTRVVRREAAPVGAHERLDHRPAEPLAQVEGDVRHSSAWQADRAARTDEGEQQARSESGAAGSIHSRSVTPTGSSPASTAFSSATAESTPPLIATAIRPSAGGSRASWSAAAIAACSGIDGDCEAFPLPSRGISAASRSAARSAQREQAAALDQLAEQRRRRRSGDRPAHGGAPR